MTKQEIKLKKKIETELRNKEFAKNKEYYESLIGIVVTLTPLYLEYFEELNNVMPEFFTNDVIKVVERNANSLYWRNSKEDKAELAQEHVDNLKEFRAIIEQSFKLKAKC
jgi:hypothetical protein